MNYQVNIVVAIVLDYQYRFNVTNVSIMEYLIVFGSCFVNSFHIKWNNRQDEKSGTDFMSVTTETKQFLFKVSLKNRLYSMIIVSVLDYINLNYYEIWSYHSGEVDDVVLLGSGAICLHLQPWRWR
jgi:hypothetical protein